MSDFTFLTFLLMAVLGVALGRRKTPLNAPLAGWVLGGFVALFVLAGIVLAAR